jgi:hypothetical protein
MDATGDPIVDAYNKAMEEKRLEEETKGSQKTTDEKK